jgi:hypothetical protein
VGRAAFPPEISARATSLEDELGRDVDRGAVLAALLRRFALATEAELALLAQRICALDTASPPGYAKPQRPVEIHCIAFGAIFESTASGSEQGSAIAFLQTLSTLGGTTFPSSANDPDNGYKWCIGSLSDRQAKLQTAFTKILDETESIILVK